MEEKYKKYYKKYTQIMDNFKIGDEIMLKDNNIPGVIMGIKLPNFYNVRLVGMDHNIYKMSNDIVVNTRIDIPEYPYIDGTFSFNYPEFHSYMNAYALTTSYDHRFNIYIIANINNYGRYPYR